MNIDTSATTRPRPWLLIVLGLAVIGFIANYMWPTSDSAATAVSASNQNRPAAKPRGKEAFNPSELDVKLETLEAERPGPGESERNPFRFQPKAAPAPPPSTANTTTPGPPEPTGPPPMPPPAPIPLKFIGTVEKGGLKVAAMSDCKGNTFFETEGKIVDGRYRLVRIGLESIVMEYPNGTGRMTIKLEGCPAR
jgi:hypothetical protein